MLNFEKICRVCMRSDQELVLIFNVNCPEVSIDIATMLGECTKYKPIRADGLPHHLCSDCLNTVKTAFNFKKNCEKSYLLLMQMLLKRNTVENAITNDQTMHFEKGTQTEPNAIHPCELCDKKFIDFNEFMLHRTCDHKNSSISCQFCLEKFNRIGYLRTHIALFHPASGLTLDNKCHICHKQFSRKVYLRRHIIGVHKIAYYKNDTTKDCESDIDDNDNDLKNMNGFENYELAKVHDNTMKSLQTEPIHSVLINETSELDNIKLEDPDAEDAFCDNIYEHLSNNDPVYVPKNEPDSQPNIMTKRIKLKGSEPYVKQEFFCGDCKKTYPNKTQYKKHCVIQHKEKKHKCNVCNESFYRKNDLKEHLHEHDQKQVTCKECAETFNTKEELNTHKKVEGHNKTMLCTECGLRCKSKASLIVHMRRHTGEKPFKCTFCNKGFPCRDDLKKHERYHTGERNHVCETCGKGFQRKYHLSIHLRVHTGEKPYKCSHCPQAFTQNHDLKLHIRRHTGERLRCELCDSTFLQAYKLRQHKLAAHGIKEEPPTQRVSKFTTSHQIKDEQHL